MNWDALETPLDEAPVFFCEPPDKDPASEHERQAELVRRCRARGWSVTAIPNARGWGMKAWNLAVAEGVEWGASDLVITAPGGRIAFVEMKNGSVTLESIRKNDQHQIDWLNAKHRQGFPVGIFRRADSVIAWLLEQGFPKARRLHAA